MTAAQLYESRKLAHECTYPSKVTCPRAPEAGAQLCPVHLRRKRKSDARSAKRRRADRKAKGLCRDCGKKSPRTVCHACSIAQGRVPTTMGRIVVGNTPAPDRQWRAGTHESDATTQRYRGRAKRGKPPAALIDDQDLQYAIEALQKARAGLALASSPEVAQLPRLQREAAKQAALAYVRYAGRFEDEVLDRNKMSR